ncbi:Probable RNA-directed DNA polymerase from transposon BS [Eumeta japonica]|uniref:Probable RNA-directed DNA polymerase from transposon BS n=1 Tax=Eumeta variegata TaxID=151549 RepID=A0A4C1ZPL3_EUMVA|nr:Probable RNA-directed DNA polymerase from transposon BS [Eumeta japonica]
MSLLLAIFNACLKNCYFPPFWKKAELIGIPKPRIPRNLPASYRPISLLSNLVEYITEGFKTKKRTVVVFLDVAKTFNRVWHAGLIYELYLLENPEEILWKYSTLNRQQASSWRCSLTTPPFIYAALQNATSALTSRGRSMSWLVQTWRIEVNPEKSAAISFIYKKGRSSVVVAHGTARNSVLHRDLNLPSITKYMKNASERFFSIAESHSNPFLSAAVSYEAPPPYHFILTFCAERTPLRDPPQGKSRAVNTLM